MVDGIIFSHIIYMGKKILILLSIKNNNIIKISNNNNIIINLYN